MIDIIIPEEYTDLVDSPTIEKAALITLQQVKRVDELELTIVVDSDERVKELNLQFMGIDAPTDVLSFPADEFDPDTGLRYLGDMIISYPTAKAQAEAAGVSMMDEIQLLVVHGMLHLLGHDHGSVDEKARMWLVQAEILKLLGVNITHLPE